MGTTLLSEIRSYQVDEIGKQSVFRQTCSAKLQDSDTLDSGDFIVTSTQNKTIDLVNKAFCLRSMFPVEVTLTQVGPVNATPQPVVIPTDYTGVLTVFNITAGHGLVIGLEDKDLPLLTPTVRVVIFNTRTGETEQLELIKQFDGTFSATLPTVYDTAKGTDFDGTMNCSHLDVLRIIYHDNVNISGQQEDVSVEITTFSPFVDTDLQVNQFIYVGKPIAILAKDVDLAGSGTYPCTIINNTTGEVESVSLVETSPGIFALSFPTAANTSTYADNDGVLSVSVDDIISVIVTDTKAATTPTVSGSITVRSDANTNGLITLPSTVVPDTSIPVILFDYDLTGSIYIDIAVSNMRTGEFEYVRCTEKVIGTGVFEGTLDLVSAASVSGDNKLNVAYADTIQASYLDITTDSGSSLLVKGVATVVPPTGSSPSSPPIVPPVPPAPAFQQQTITILCTGLFVFHGSFNGSIVISGLSSEAVRCSLTHI